MAASSDQNVLPRRRGLGPERYVIKDGTLTFFCPPKQIGNQDSGLQKKISYPEITSSQQVTDMDDIGNQDSGLQKKIPSPEITSFQQVTDMDDIGELSQYSNLGEPSCVCSDCGALMWYEERIQKYYNAAHPKFGMCCMQGRISLPAYKELPQPLNDLFHKYDKKGNFFLDNIRSFNSMFAFTSMGGKINNTMNNGSAPPMFTMNGENYHRIGSLLPMPGNQPKFAQLYIYDTENEISNRMTVVGMEGASSSLKAEIVADLKQLLEEWQKVCISSFEDFMQYQSV